MYLRLSYVIIFGALLATHSIANGFTIRRRGLVPMTSDHRIAQLQADQAMGNEIKVPAGYGVRDPQLLGRRRRALVVPNFWERLAQSEIYESDNPSERILLLRLRSPQVYR